MHYKDRSTVCISTQAGCAMACSFCATGQAGFDRHLTVGEIVEQVRGRPPGRRDGRRRPVERGLHGDGRAPRQLRPDVGVGGADPGRPGRPAPATCGVDGRDRPGHPQARRRGVAGEPRQVSLHAADDEPPKPAGPDQQALSAVDALMDACAGLPPGQGGAACRSSGRSSTASTHEVDALQPPSSAPGPLPLARPTNLIPLNPTPGFAGRCRARRGAGEGVARAAPARRGQRHHPAHPRHLDRRRLRSAPGEPRGRRRGRPRSPPDRRYRRLRRGGGGGGPP